MLTPALPMTLPSDSPHTLSPQFILRETLVLYSLKLTLQSFAVTVDQIPLADVDLRRGKAWSG